MTSSPADNHRVPSGITFTHIGIYLGILWVLVIVDWLFGLQLAEWGLRPRELRGLIGILTMPWLHAGFGHVASNTLPLAILLAFLPASTSRSLGIAVLIALLTGLLLWLFGRSHHVHVGASGLVYGLAGYFIVRGVVTWHFRSMVVALLVLFFFGGSLFWGVLPIGNQGVSWDGHLCGFLAGSAIACIPRSGPTTPRDPFQDDLLRDA